MYYITYFTSELKYVSHGYSGGYDESSVTNRKLLRRFVLFKMFGYFLTDLVVLYTETLIRYIGVNDIRES